MTLGRKYHLQDRKNDRPLGGLPKRKSRVGEKSDALLTRIICSTEQPFPGHAQDLDT